MSGLSKPSNQVYAWGPEPRIEYWNAVTGAIEMARLVKLGSATEVTKTGAGDFETIGAVERELQKEMADTYAIGDAVPVILLQKGQVLALVAGAVIAVGARVETGADGKVVTYAPTAIGDAAAAIGVALEAASADGDRILVEVV